MASVKDQPQIAARIAQAYADSLQWCSANAERCGQLVATHLPMLSAEAVTDSLAVAQMDAVPAAEAQGGSRVSVRAAVAKESGADRRQAAGR